MAYPLVLFANVGTSVIGYFRRTHAERAPDFEAALAELKAAGHTGSDLEASGHNAPGAALIEQLEAAASADPSAASAEINSIFKLSEELERGEDEPLISAIFLLATDTIEGMLTAQVVKNLLGARYKNALIKVDRIAGLQVHDSAQFVRYGLPGYIEKVYEHLHKWPVEACQRIFIPTGGFKALVPYMTLIAMLEGADTRYIFERSDALLTLQPLPIGFDDALVEQALPAMGETEERGTITQAVIEELLDLDAPLRATPFASLWTYFEGEEYVLSGLGEILWQRHRNITDPVWLSSKARRDLEKLDPDARRDVLEGLIKLRSRGYRASGQHGVYRSEKTDCRCLGRQQVNYRIHFWEEADAETLKIRVARLFHIKGNRHDQRDRVLDGPGIFKKDFESWERYDYDA